MSECASSFFFMAEAYSVVCLYHFLFTHSFANGHLSCFHILTVMNNAGSEHGSSNISFRIYANNTDEL